MRTTVHGVGAAVFLTVLGCQPRADTPPPASTARPGVTAADLGKLGFALAGYEDGFKRGPSSAADLKPFLDGTPQERAAWQRVTDGDVVVIWGAYTKAMPAGPAATVVAYTRDVPASGGLALFGSGEVRTLTAAEFARSPKAVPPH